MASERKNDYVRSRNLLIRRGIQVLVVNQVLPTNFLDEAGLNSTSRSRPTMNSLAKRKVDRVGCLKMEIAKKAPSVESESFF